MIHNLYIDTDNLIEITNVTDKLTDDLISDATVTANLYTAAGAAVSGGQNIDCPATSTAGEYAGVMPSSVVLTEDAEYEIRVTVEATVGSTEYQTEIVISCKAVYKGKDYA